MKLPNSWPRYIRVSVAPAYLGMGKDTFNKLVRPKVRELRFGPQQIAFDRLDLDEWADDYTRRNGRPGGRIAICEEPPDFTRQRTASGGSINGSEGMAEFRKALAVARSKGRRNS